MIKGEHLNLLARREVGRPRGQAGACMALFNDNIPLCVEIFSLLTNSVVCSNMFAFSSISLPISSFFRLICSCMYFFGLGSPDRGQSWVTDGQNGSQLFPVKLTPSHIEDISCSSCSI